VVLLIIGGLSTHPGSQNFFANRMPAVLWILAVGSYWTFAHRMYHTWREVQRVEAGAGAKASAINGAPVEATLPVASSSAETASHAGPDQRRDAPKIVGARPSREAL
jgi:hypothetical protein